MKFRQLFLKNEQSVSFEGQFSHLAILYFSSVFPFRFDLYKSDLYKSE